MGIDTGELWRAHQAVQSRKHREIEITQRVLDLPPAVLRLQCRSLGIAHDAGLSDATLRRQLTDRLLAQSPDGRGR